MVYAPAKCELRRVIRLLQEKNVVLLKFIGEGAKYTVQRLRVSVVYGDGAENFINRIDVYDASAQGLKSVAAVSLVQHVDQMVYNQ